jgi:hypothetical protein
VPYGLPYGLPIQNPSVLPSSLRVYGLQPPPTYPPLGFAIVLGFEIWTTKRDHKSRRDRLLSGNTLVVGLGSLTVGLLMGT